MGPSPTVAFRRPHPAVPRVRGRVLARQEGVAGVALLIVSFHLLLDAATRSRPPSVTALELAGALLVAPTVFVLFFVRGRLAQTALAGTAGLAALWLGVAGWVPGAVMAGRRASDFSGIALALAGIVLIAVALTIALRGRRRVVQVAFALPALLVTLQWVLCRRSRSASSPTRRGRPSPRHAHSACAAPVMSASLHATACVWTAGTCRGETEQRSSYCMAPTATEPRRSPTYAS